MRLDRLRLGVGVLAGRTERGDDLVEVAAAHELGTSTIPARSFVASTIRDHRREIVGRLARMSAAEIHSEHSAAEMGDVGRWLAGRMRARILETDIPPPLQPETIRRKERENRAHPSKPLVATGDMADAISWRLT